MKSFKGKIKFLLAIFSCAFFACAEESVWSNVIELDFTGIGTVLELEKTDEIAYSTLWAAGTNRSCQVTAQKEGESEAQTIFSCSDDGAFGTFTWDYLNEEDEIVSDDVYTLTHKIFSGNDLIDTKTAQVTLLPEPLGIALAALLLFFLPKKPKTLFLASLLCLLAAQVRAEELSEVKIATRWPWEGKVDIAYTISGGSPTQVYNVAFYGQGDGGETFLLKTLSGDGANGTVIGNGNFLAVWDAMQDLTNAKFSEFSVKVAWQKKSALSDNTVKIVYAGDTATVEIADNITEYVTSTKSGAHVQLAQSALVSSNTCGEITYLVSGSSSDGELYVAGSYKSTFVLSDLNLTNPSGAAININNGKRINLTLEGTNSVTDCSSGSQKACFIVKGHAEVKGGGLLYIRGLTKHGFKSGEYLELKKTFTGSIVVSEAAGDGLHIGQYFDMKNGQVEIVSAGDDGVQIEANNEGEINDGMCLLRGGKLIINVAASDVKGLKCDAAMIISDELENNTTLNITCASTAYASQGLKSGGDMTISGGDIKISTAGKGIWDTSTSNDFHAAASSCIKCSSNLYIYGGTFNLTSTGSGGKGINVDGALAITNGNLVVVTSGGLYYNNGTTENTNYTGDTDRIDDSYTSSPKGIKVDGNVDISGGNISVTTSGNNAEGIESKSVLRISGGDITINAYDDGINSSGDLYISGGTVSVVSKSNDGIDTNGSMYLSGGTIIACGAASPECGLDADERCVLYITGGNVLGIGGGNNSVTATSGSQALVDVSGSVSANSVISVSNGTETLYSFTVPSTYSSSSSGGGGPGGGPGGGGGSSRNLLISLPNLVSGTTYTVKRDETTLGTSQAATSYRGR